MRASGLAAARAVSDVVGRLLVGLQFAALGLMAWRAWHSPPPLSGAVLVPLVVSAALALWALSANRPGNFNIRPAPRVGGVLVTTGPYRWIRHPMYTAVLLAGAALALKAQQGADAGLMLLLLVVLWVKAGVEERALLARFADYAAYQARTKAFVPGIL